MAYREPFERVLSAAQADSPWAYEQLYRALSPSICGYLRLQGVGDPEDLTSEVFLGAFRGIKAFRGDEAQFRSWVFTIAHRRLTDDRRSPVAGRRDAAPRWPTPRWERSPAATSRGRPSGASPPTGSGRCAPAWPLTIPPVSVPIAAGATPGSTSAGGSANANVTGPGLTPTIPNLPGLPGLPGLSQVTVPAAINNLIKGLPACVGNLIPAGGATPDPTRLAAQIPACITQVMGTGSLPPEVAKCVSSILGTIGGAAGMSPSAVPNIAGLGVSSCVPIDVSRCVTNLLGLLGTLPGGTGGIPGLGSLPDLGSLPGLSAVTGCVPMNVTACLTSITGGVSAGTTPKLDLSACMPTTSGLPDVGGLPGLGSLPGLGGALPFFGK